MTLDLRSPHANCITTTWMSPKTVAPLLASPPFETTPKTAAPLQHPQPIHIRIWLFRSEFACTTTNHHQHLHKNTTRATRNKLWKPTAICVANTSQSHRRRRRHPPQQARTKTMLDELPDRTTDAEGEVMRRPHLVAQPPFGSTSWWIVVGFEEKGKRRCGFRERTSKTTVEMWFQKR